MDEQQEGLLTFNLTAPGQWVIGLALQEYESGNRYSTPELVLEGERMRSVLKQSHTFTNKYSIDSVVGLSENASIALASSQSGEYVLIYVLDDKYFI